MKKIFSEFIFCIAASNSSSSYVTAHERETEDPDEVENYGKPEDIPETLRRLAVNN